jgi:integrase
MPLTDKVILNAKPNDKEYLLSDGGGLYLRVKPNGKKLWRGYYQVQTKRMRMHLGGYPELSLKKAREAVLIAKYQISQGVDPKANLDQKQQAILETPGSRAEEQADEDITIDQVTQHSPFRTLTLAWFNRWKVGKEPKFVKRARNRLTDNLFPVLGSIPINEIRPRDIVRMARSVETRLKGGTELAQRSIQTAAQIFRLAIAEELVEGNPATAIKPRDVLLPFEKKNQARVDEKKFPALLVAIDEYEGRLTVKYALKLMVLVFLRTSEMIPGVWPEVDYEDLLWRVPGERMKRIRSERKKRTEPHLVPLARQTVDLLEQVKKLSNRSPKIFPGEYSKSGSIHHGSLLEALDELGYKGIQTGHGFRGIASTILNDRGFSKDVIELQLSHMKKDKVAAAYNHAQYLDQRRELMQAWADYVDDALRRGYEARERGLQAADAAD